ncbi:MAG: glutathione synthase [Burkholderiales bacterium]|nr:glutathione synthase [Burkholderiales bacterium]MDQ3195318.1 glutathione synthase [Pseudomonadota bacterium]
MKLAFVVDPLDRLKPYKDSSVAMMREAAQRGHALYAMRQSDLAWSENQVVGRARGLTLTNDTVAWYRAGKAEAVPLHEFSAVLMRKDPPFDNEYLYSTYLLELAEKNGARVFNSPRALRDHNEKLAIAEFPELIAPTLVSRAPELLHSFIEEHGDVIFKPLDGMGGSSIFRVRQGDPNSNVIIETLTKFGARTVMGQRYIPAIANGDKRILLIDGEPIPYALARIPQAGETRGNLAAGGTGVAQPLSARDRQIAETLGPRLRERGLLLVGLDIIGDYLTEINVTSPTCMVEIAAQTGFSAAVAMLDALEKRCCLSPLLQKGAVGRAQRGA